MSLEKLCCKVLYLSEKEKRDVVGRIAKLKQQQQKKEIWNKLYRNIWQKQSREKTSNSGEQLSKLKKWMGIPERA